MALDQEVVDEVKEFLGEERIRRILRMQKHYA
jgi:hypothetical protein